MKKAVSLILALLMCLTLCACGGNSNYSISITQSNGDASTIQASELQKYASEHSYSFTDEYIIGEPRVSFTATIKGISYAPSYLYDGKYADWICYEFDNGIYALCPMAVEDRNDTVTVTGNFVAISDTYTGDMAILYLDADMVMPVDYE